MTDSPTVRCPLCGTATGEARCPVCGSPVDRHEAPTTAARTAPAATASTLIHSPTAPSSGPLIPWLATDDPTSPPSAVLRQTSVDDGERQTARRRALIAAGLVGTVLLLVAGIQLSTRGDSSDAVTQPAGAAVATEDSAQAIGEDASSEEAVQPEEPEETSTAELRIPAGGVWIVVLESIPKAESDLSEAVAVAGTVGNQGTSVEVIDSDVTPGLNPGYWVVIHGDLAARAEAAQVCSSLGREVGGECYPRLIG